MKQVTLEEKSAGGVVFRRAKKDSRFQIPDSRGIEFLIGKHSGYHKWVLPKGLVERGESPQEAAVREVAEEVGVEAWIVDQRTLRTVEYWYYADLDTSGKTTRRVAKYAEAGGAKTRVHKQVVFYLMELENDLGSAGWEMEERRWVNYEEGRKLLAFESEREVWEAAGRVMDKSAPAET